MLNPGFYIHNLKKGSYHRLLCTTVSAELVLFNSSIINFLWKTQLCSMYLLLSDLPDKSELYMLLEEGEDCKR